MAAPLAVFIVQADEQGGMRAEDAPALRRHLQRKAGKRLAMTLKEYREQRTSPQSRYYYGVVVALMADELGYERDEMHEALAFKFLSISGPDDPLPRRRSTADLDTGEMTTYIEQCRRLAAELGIYVPDPNEAEAA